MCDSKQSTFFRPWNSVCKGNQEHQAVHAESLERNGDQSVADETDTESNASSRFSEDNVTGDSFIEGSGQTEETIEESGKDSRSRTSSESSSDRTTFDRAPEEAPIEIHGPNFVDHSVVSQIGRANAITGAQNFCNFRRAPFNSADYLKTSLECVAMALQPLAPEPIDFAAINNSMGGVVAGEVSATSRAGDQPSVYQTLYAGHHPLMDFAGFSSSIGASSMEQAVQLVHHQDAAAKQMKKMRPKKFRCEYCDVAFSNNGQLKGHVRIHTGERPFKCTAEGCGKSFTRNEELTRHKRIHTGQRPHACIICGKRFGRKDHLKKHTRTHENRDPYRSASALQVFIQGHGVPPLNGAPPIRPFYPYVYPYM